MNIKLNEKYVLKSDKTNIWIAETKETEKGKKVGEEYENTVTGYHGTLANCLKAFVKRSLRMSQAETLEELSADVRRIEKDIEEFCKSINSIELLRR